MPQIGTKDPRTEALGGKLAITFLEDSHTLNIKALKAALCRNTLIRDPDLVHNFDNLLYKGYG